MNKQYTCRFDTRLFSHIHTNFKKGLYTTSKVHQMMQNTQSNQIELFNIIPDHCSKLIHNIYFNNCTTIKRL